MQQQMAMQAEAQGAQQAMAAASGIAQQAIGQRLAPGQA